MSDTVDFTNLFASKDLDLLLASLGSSADSMSEADRLRLLRVMVAFLGVCLKVDLDISI